MDPLAVLTFIAAPAIDRVRALYAELGSRTAMPDALKQLRLKQLRFASRRVLLVIRALTAFYVSLGSFAAACLTSQVLAHLDAGDGAPGRRIDIDSPA
jgi:hypothetical protein